MLGVTRKTRMIPLTREGEFLTRSNTKLERWETVILPAIYTSSQKIWNRLHVPSRPLL
jgi:hypothetical protein